MNIFQIDQKYLELQGLLEDSDGELTPEIEKLLNDDSDTIQNKYTNYVNMYNYFSHNSDVISEEIKRLSALKKSADSAAERLKDNLAGSLKLRNLDKYDGGLFKLSFRKSTSVLIEDESKISKKFLKVITSVDKAEISKVLKSGKKVPGASLKENSNLQIK